MIPNVAAAQLDDLQRRNPICLATAYPNHRTLAAASVGSYVATGRINGMRHIIALHPGESVALADYF